MKLIAALLVGLLASQPALVLAQPTSPPSSAPASQPGLLSLPKGRQLTTPQGILRGYTLAEFKVLLKIEASYRSWGLQLPTYRKMVSDFKQLTENQVKQVKLLQNQMLTLKTDRSRLSKKWTEENRLRHLAENRPNFGSWLSWGVAAAMAATAAVLAGILIARD